MHKCLSSVDMFLILFLKKLVGVIEISSRDEHKLKGCKNKQTMQSTYNEDGKKLYNTDTINNHIKHTNTCTNISYIRRFQFG